MIKTIVVGVDGSAESEKALALTAEIATKHAAELVIVHALLANTGVDALRAIANRLGFIGDIEPQLEQAVLQPLVVPEAGTIAPTPVIVVSSETLRRFGELVLVACERSASTAGAQVSTRLVNADPLTALLDAVKMNKADLLAVGNRGMGRLEGLLLGSVSQKIVQEAPCPCLIVR
jgi:nucleotide-binding universal stress UspA family protein